MDLKKLINNIHTPTDLSSNNRDTRCDPKLIFEGSSVDDSINQKSLSQQKTKEKSSLKRHDRGDGQKEEKGSEAYYHCMFFEHNWYKYNRTV